MTFEDLTKVSVRDGFDEWHLEGWFKDGQKYAVAVFDQECEAIADEIALMINKRLADEC